MAPDGYILSGELLRRLLAALEWIEADGKRRGVTVRPSSSGSRPARPIWGRITARQGKAYDWEERRPKSDGTWEAPPDPLTSAGSGKAYELNGSEDVAVDTIVRLLWHPTPQQNAGVWLFEYGTDIGGGGGGGVPVPGTAFWCEIRKAATVTLSDADWRGCHLSYSACYCAADTRDIAEAYTPDQWTHYWTSPQAWFVGTACTGTMTLFEKTLPGNLTARLYLDEADGGKLKLAVTGGGEVDKDHLVIRIEGGRPGASIKVGW